MLKSVYKLCNFFSVHSDCCCDLEWTYFIPAGEGKWIILKIILEYLSFEITLGCIFSGEIIKMSKINWVVVKRFYMYIAKKRLLLELTNKK